MKNIVSSTEDSIIIEFDKLFERDLKNYNTFKIAKRSYRNNLSTLENEIKNYIEVYECEDYAYNMLYFKYKTFKDIDKLSIDYAREFLKEKVFKDEKLINTVKNEVESVYNLSVDTFEQKNENLQITNELNKKYLMSAIMMRLIIPMICTISDLISLEELDKYIFELYTDIMIFFNDGDDIIIKKIYNIVSSRITSTRYSDKEIWEFLRKQNLDIQIIIRRFYNYVIVNSFVKILNNTSIISYIDVILRNKLNFAFRLDYKISHKTLDYNNLSNNKSNDDNLTEIDKLEATLLKQDKGIYFINEASVRMKVKELKKKFDNDETFLEFKDIYKFNEFTKIFLEIYYKKEFDIVYKKEYISYLLYNMIIELRNKKFTLIPKIIISEVKYTRINNKMKIAGKLSESVKYHLLLDKYNIIRNIINDNNFVYNIIVKLKSKQFIDPVTEEEIDLTLDKLNEEILDFLFLNK